MKKGFKNFLQCKQTWIAITALIALLLHNLLSSYEASQFTLIANMLIGVLVYNGYLSKCEDKEDKKTCDKKHRK